MLDKKWSQLSTKTEDLILRDDKLLPESRDMMLNVLKEIGNEIDLANQEHRKALPVEDDVLQNLKNKLQNWAEYGRLVSEGFKGNRTMEPVDVSTLAQRSGARWEPIFQNRGIELKMHIEDNLQIWGEKSLVEQIIENLIDNALKATEKGRVSVRCTASHDQIIIEVEDTGCGIPDEELGAIFKKPFYQGKGRESLDKSTGIGLFLVFQYAKSIQGTVEAESKAGRGSIFRVKLPVLDNSQLRSGENPAAA